jgi:hypothetical protein
MPHAATVPSTNLRAAATAGGSAATEYVAARAPCCTGSASRDLLAWMVVRWTRRRSKPKPRSEILKLRQLWAVETLRCVVEQQHVAALDVAGCEDGEGPQRPDRRGLAVGERGITAGEVVQRTSAGAIK